MTSAAASTNATINTQLTYGHLSFTKFYDVAGIAAAVTHNVFQRGLLRTVKTGFSEAR